MEHFIEQLTGQGVVELVSDEAPNSEGWEAALVQAEELVRLEWPGAAPAFKPAAARWAAEFVYQGCRFAAFRHLDQAQLETAFASPCPGDKTHPSIIYSVDLCMRYLPDLLRLTRGLAPDDPLNAPLAQLVTDWPLSAVGVENPPGDLAVDYLLAHPGLRQQFIDRILLHRDKAHTRQPGVVRAIRETLGGHPDLLQDAARWLRTAQSEKEPAPAEE